MQTQFKMLREAIRDFGIEVTGVVEAGARDCKETLDFKSAYPKAKIIAFECDPNCIPICKKNIAGTDITLIEKAISDHAGTAEFHVSPDSGSSSLLGTVFPESKKIRVPMSTLKDELEEAPTVLWLDAEGGELAILKGAQDLLDGVSIINIEVRFKRTLKDQPLYWDIKKFLYSRGFRLLRFAGAPYGFCDVIFINKKIRRFPVPAFLIEFDELFIKKVLRKILRDPYILFRRGPFDYRRDVR